MRYDLEWHPYRICIRHELKHGDFLRKMNFCRWISERCENPRFFHNLVIGDEACFALNGKVNSHNVRMYLIGQNNVGQNFRRTKLFVGQNFRH